MDLREMGWGGMDWIPVSHLAMFIGLWAVE
jgi:hypothetical protein